MSEIIETEKRFYHGDMARDAREYRGWLLGSFATDQMRRVGEMEVKYWGFAPGVTEHERKTSDTLEVTMLLGGAIRGEIDGQEFLFQEGQYVIIPPGVPNNTVIEALTPAWGITIKAPSDPEAKRIV
jgi:quercetin dioxygenase-like cupin family protein